MADDAPGSWTNVEDEVILPSVATIDTTGQGMVGMAQHSYELLTNEAAGNTVQAIGHNHGDAKGGEDGTTIWTTPWSKSFINNTTDYFSKTLLFASGWTEILNVRIWVEAFQDCAMEIYWYATAGDGIEWRLRHAAAVNNGNVNWVADTTHVLEETAAAAPGAVAWSWITGQVDGLGAATFNHLPIYTVAAEGAISPTDFKTMRTRREFLLEARDPTAGDTTIRIYSASLHHVRTDDVLT